MSDQLPTDLSNYHIVSIREFSRCAGVSDTSIRKAIAAGRISAAAVQTNKKNNRPELIYELALADWLAVGGELVKLPPFIEGEVIQDIDPAEQNNQPGKKGDLFNQPPVKEKSAKDVEQGVGAYAMANTRSVILKANLLEIELEEKKGNLVSKEKVYKKLYEFGNTMRSRILSIPDRHIDDIFSSSDRNEAHLKLQKALTEALEHLSKPDVIS